MGFAAADLFSMLKGKPFDYVNIFTSVCSRMLPTFLKNAVKSTAANGSLAPMYCSPGICIFPSFRSFAATPPGNATVSWSEEKPNCLCGKPCCKRCKASIWSPTSNTWALHILYVGVLLQILFRLHVNSLFGHIHTFYVLKTHFMVRKTLNSKKDKTELWTATQEKMCLNFEE